MSTNLYKFPQIYINFYKFITNLFHSLWIVFTLVSPLSGEGVIFFFLVLPFYSMGGSLKKFVFRFFKSSISQPIGWFVKTLVFRINYFQKWTCNLKNKFFH